MMQIDTTTKKLLTDPQKRWAWIIFQLSCIGRSLSDVGCEHGVRRQTIYQVQKRPYPRMEKAISDALRVDLRILFPERYTEDGLPNRKWGRPYKKASFHGGKDTRANKPRNTQSSRVA